MKGIDKKIPLVEVFGPTIQGEGAVIGQPTYFLRFGLCDYDCTMCDSRHAVDPNLVKANAEWLKQDDIYDRLYRYRYASYPLSAKTVTFSGGNPCIHDLSYLVGTLKTGLWKIAVETQGTKCPKWLTDCDWVTVSPKGPGMGEKYEPEVFHLFMYSLRTGPVWHPGLNIKVVVFDPADLEFAARIAFWCIKNGFPLERLYLSQGNPYLPGKQDIKVNEQTNRLRTYYLQLFEEIQENHTILSNLKFLPQFHVWLFGNKQGV